jgi:polar amino acid transport system substrate-binding protein
MSKGALTVRTILAVLVATFVVLSALSAQAQNSSSTLSRMVLDGELRVGMSGTQPPMNVLGKDGELIGLEVDMMNLLAESMNLKLRVIQKPFAELLPALDNGAVDMVVSGLTITPERNMKYMFVGPYFISGKSILTTSAGLGQTKDPSALNQAELKLAALKSSTSEQFVKRVAPKATFVGIDDYDQGVQMVLDGKVDALVADFPICALSVIRNPGKGLTTPATAFTIEPIGIALPGDDPLLANLLQNYLRALEGAGLLDRLETRYLEDGAWLEKLP